MCGGGDEIFEIEWFEVREQYEYSSSKVHIHRTAWSDRILEDLVASVADDRTRDRHEHGESWRDYRGEKETQSEEGEQFQEYTENRQEEHHIEHHSLWEENRDEDSELDEDHECEHDCKSRELAEYDRSASDRLREDEVYRTTLDLTSDEPSSE